MLLSERQKELISIYRPYFDYKTCELKEGAPEEAKKALEEKRRIARERMSDFDMI